MAFHTDPDQAAVRKLTRAEIPKLRLGIAGRPGLLCGLVLVLTLARYPLLAQAVQAGSPDTGFEQLAQDAAKARDGGQSILAIELYRQALKSKPDWDEGWWWLGVLLYEEDRYPQAIQSFRVVTDLKPEMGPAWLMVGLCQFAAKDYYRSLESINRSLTLGVGANEALRITGSFHKAILLNRFEEHEAAFDILWLLARNHAQDPRMPGALGVWALRLPLLPSEVPVGQQDMVLKAGQAFVAASQEDVETASALLESLVESYPTQPNAHYAFGQFLRVRDADRALELFQKELQISPNHIPARLQIAYLLMSRGQPERALKYAQEALEIQSDSVSGKYVLGLVLFNMKDYEKSVPLFEEVVRAFPGSARVRGSLAQAYFRVGRKEEADVQLAEAERLQSQRLELEQGLITSGQAQDRKQDDTPPQ